MRRRARRFVFFWMLLILAAYFWPVQGRDLSLRTVAAVELGNARVGAATHPEIVKAVIRAVRQSRFGGSGLKCGTEDVRFIMRNGGSIKVSVDAGNLYRVHRQLEAAGVQLAATC